MEVDLTGINCYNGVGNGFSMFVAECDLTDSDGGFVMRILLSSAFVGLIALSLVYISPSDARIDPGAAVGIWLLDEGDDEMAYDSSDKGNDGTLQGDPEWVEGKFGSALSLNGSMDRVVIPDNDTLDLQEEWTITAWVYVNKSESGYGHILGKRAGETNYAFRTSESGTGCRRTRHG